MNDYERKIVVKHIRDIERKITRLEWILESYKNDKDVEYINNEINELKSKKEKYIKSIKD
ncbi:hypothetical protein ACO3UB_01555 [Methanocaldococcus sp. 16A]